MKNDRGVGDNMADSTLHHQGAHTPCGRHYQQPRSPDRCRLAVEAHLDIVHAQDVPAVVHVLLKVFVLEKRRLLERSRGCNIWQTSPALQKIMNNNNNNVCSPEERTRTTLKVSAEVNPASPGIQKPV